MPPIPPTNFNLRVHIIHAPRSIGIVHSIALHPAAVDGAGVYLRCRFHEQVQLIIIYQVVFHTELPEYVVADDVVEVGVGT